MDDCPSTKVSPKGEGGGGKKKSSKVSGRRRTFEEEEVKNLNEKEKAGKSKGNESDRRKTFAGS